MVAGGAGMGKPARVKLSTNTSRRCLYMLADFLDAILRAVEGGGGGDLDRREGAVVEIGFDPSQRSDQPLVADREADAPAGHVVGLGKRRELDRDILGARAPAGSRAADFRRSRVRRRRCRRG